MRTLDYATAAVPSEFDVELQSERARWLRRRFVWFCFISIIAALSS